jgi:AbrB family looped-hinge helix DNA binding protein
MSTLVVPSKGRIVLPAEMRRRLGMGAGARVEVLEDRDAVLMAVEAFDKGLDFADALHLARSPRAAGFATFDQRLANRAKTLALTPPLELLV